MFPILYWHIYMYVYIYIYIYIYILFVLFVFVEFSLSVRDLEVGSLLVPNIYIKTHMIYLSLALRYG
jgi:hypothetical protein